MQPICRKLTHASVSEEVARAVSRVKRRSGISLASHENRTASFVGLARVVGRIGERSGTFVMQDVGTFENGIAKGKWTILSGTSTGDLAGISGDGHFDTKHDNATYTLEVSF